MTTWAHTLALVLFANTDINLLILSDEPHQKIHLFSHLKPSKCQVNCLLFPTPQITKFNFLFLLNAHAALMTRIS